MAQANPSKASKAANEALAAELAELRALLSAQQATIAALERRIPQAQAASAAATGETGDAPNTTTPAISEESAPQQSVRRGTSRRGLLRGAAAGAAAAAVAAVAIGGAEQAHAAPETSGNPWILGETNDAGATTGLVNTVATSPTPLFEVGNVFDGSRAIVANAGDGGIAIQGEATGATTTNSTGIRGITDNGYGVLGQAQAGTGTGIGVVGTSTSGLGAKFSGSLAPLLLGLGGAPGAPSTGTHSAGEVYLDSNATMWLCVIGGASGTWAQVTTLPFGFNGGSVAFLPNPMRLLDTRNGATDAIQTPNAPCQPNTPYAVNVAGATNGTQTVPVGAIGALGNVTAVNTPAAGFIALVPHGAGLQGTSNVNYVAGEIIPNFFVVNLNSGHFDVIVDPNSQAVDVLIDLFAFIF